jgi:single-strand DNA-binding protein
MIVVSGRLQVSSWTDKDGNKRRSTAVVADSCYFGDSKRDASAPQYATANTPESDFAVLDDDDATLPF